MKKLIVIGCGGLMYHGLPRMMGWLARRDNEVEVILIDADVVEERNGLRQWATGTGRTKVEVARDAMIALGYDPDKVVAYPMTVQDAYSEVGLWMDEDEVYVLTLPDNHLARVLSIPDDGELPETMAVVAAGNNMEGGWCYSMVSKGNGWMGDWRYFHPDIVEEAQREEYQLAHPAPCGNQPNEGLGQTAGTNTLTAHCVWELMEKMVDFNWTGEVKWALGENEKVNVRVVERPMLTAIEMAKEVA